MSYIRCTSNPENLYSWDDIDGNIYFNWTDRKGNHREISANSKVFKQFMVGLKIMDGYVMSEPLTHQDISIREIMYNVNRNYICKKFPYENGKFPKYKFDHLICLQIGKEKLLMYDVTWKWFYDNYFWEPKTVIELISELIKTMYFRTIGCLERISWNFRGIVWKRKNNNNR
jgi:hypothetical protein